MRAAGTELRRTTFMLQLLARRWWALALRGVIAVLFGLLTFFIPGVTLISLVLLFGFYAILDGIFDIVSAMKAPGHHWPLVVEGIVGIVAGIVTFMWPGITAMFLLYLIAFWAILTGVLENVAGIRLREVIANEMLLILMGVISTLFGILIIIFPGAGAFLAIIDLDRGLCIVVRNYPFRPGIPAPELPPVRSVSEGPSLCPSMRDSCGLENKIRR